MSSAGSLGQGCISPRGTEISQRKNSALARGLKPFNVVKRGSGSGTQEGRMPPLRKAVPSSPLDFCGILPTQNSRQPRILFFFPFFFVLFFFVLFPMLILALPSLLLERWKQIKSCYSSLFTPKARELWLLQVTQDSSGMETEGIPSSLLQRSLARDVHALIKTSQLTEGREEKL